MGAHKLMLALVISRRMGIEPEEAAEEEKNPESTGLE
jgi:hypothetical protein